jgi:transcriptional regulator with XRE-family HTH domain
MNVLAERLKKARKQHQLTQRQLAAKLGISQSTVALYETGDRNPDPDTLNKLADFFNVSTDCLLGRVNDPTSIKEPNIKEPGIKVANIEGQETKITFHGRELTAEQMRQLRKYISRVLLDDEDESDQS